MLRIGAGLVLIMASSAVAGCYVMQSARGQLALMSRRTPIGRVLADPATPPALRAKLEAVRSIREFASEELGLPDNGSYRSYADVGRQYVVWNVVAAPEFAVDPKQWCYPIIGCVAYRGYFVESKARSFAATLRLRGFDVAVGGVAAYSTLGHFDDPILNTMVGWNDIELAAIVFHELTHQLLYVPGDSSFNEALATTVEAEGVRRWLVHRGRGADLQKYAAEQKAYLTVIELLRRTRDTLRLLYGSGIDQKSMREGKQSILEEMRAAYTRLAKRGGPAPFDSWFAGEINNAHLASIATYYDCVPGFEHELALVDGDLKAFYARVRKVATAGRTVRDALLCATP